MRYSIAFYDNTMSLVYEGLDRNAEYELAVVYHGKPPEDESMSEDEPMDEPTNRDPGSTKAASMSSTKAASMSSTKAASTSSTKASTSRLTANDELLHDYQIPPATMQVQRYPISRNTTAGGKLVVRCNQEKGVGGTGRTCEIAEVWLRQANSRP
jgi:hypothetical protein